MKPKKPVSGIGPVTKKVAKKTAPKVPMTPSGTAEAKAAKKKARMKSVGTAIGVAGAAVGSMLADARFQRGAERIRGNRANVKVAPKDAWKAGKNQKSTKK